MKDFFRDVRALEDKLAETLAEKNLLHVMDKNRYPITLTVTQNQAPDAQMELYDTTDGHLSSQDSVLRFVFHLDRLEIQTNSRLVIDDKFMNKIKGQAKKIHALHVHAYFAASITTLRAAADEPAETEDDPVCPFDDFYDEPEEADTEEPDSDDPTEAFFDTDDADE
jgi:hypothetical protein